MLKSRYTYSSSRSPAPSNRNKSPQNPKSPSPTRSPRHSPVQRHITSSSTKDYSAYVPVRKEKNPATSERSQTTQLPLRVLTESNRTLTKAGDKFKELQRKRMNLENESHKLEEKMKEIRRKVEIESKSLKKISNRRPVPRSHCSLFVQKIKKIVMKKSKLFNSIGFEKIKKISDEHMKTEKIKISKFQHNVLRRLIKGWRKSTEKSGQKTSNQLGIAERHYQLQLVITAYNK